MDCSPPGSSVHGDAPGKNTGVCCHFPLQGIFQAQGLNVGLLHCWQICDHLNDGILSTLNWKVEYKERWAPKNWCFWTVVLEKSVESPLDWKETQPVHSEGHQPWVFFGRNDAEAETPILWSPEAKKWPIWKDPDAGDDWRHEEKGTRKDEMVGWHHRINGHELEQASRLHDGQGGLGYSSPWGHNELDTTMSELNWKL